MNGEDSHVEDKMPSDKLHTFSNDHEEDEEYFDLDWKKGTVYSRTVTSRDTGKE